VCLFFISFSEISFSQKCLGIWLWQGVPVFFIFFFRNQFQPQAPWYLALASCAYFVFPKE